MAERVINKPRSEFRADVISQTINGQVLHIFFALARDVAPYCVVSKRTTSDDDAYQRIFLPSRVREIKEFILSNNIIIPSIVLASEATETAPYKISKLKGGKRRIKFTPSGDHLFVVDGQHRLRGAAETDTTLSFVIAESMTAKDQAHQFVVINQESHRIPTSLLKDLLPYLDEYFEVDDPQKKVHAIAVRLDEDDNSVLQGKIERFAQNVKGKVSLTNFDRKWRPHFKTSGILGAEAVEEAYPLVRDYFAAMMTAFPEQWNSKKGNVFLKTVIFGAFAMVFPTILMLAGQAGTGRPGYDQFLSVLKRIKGVDLEGLLELGSGTSAENRASRELLLALR